MQHKSGLLKGLEMPAAAFVMAFPLFIFFASPAVAAGFSYGDLTAARAWCKDADAKLATANRNLGTNYAIAECAATSSADLVEGYFRLKQHHNFHDGAVTIAVAQSKMDKFMQGDQVLGLF